MTSTDRAPSLLAALSVICFAVAPAVGRMMPGPNFWFVSGSFTGLGIGLLIVAVRQHLKGAGSADAMPIAKLTALLAILAGISALVAGVFLVRLQWAFFALAIVWFAVSVVMLRISWRRRT